MGQQLEAAKETARRQGLAPGARAQLCQEGSAVQESGGMGKSVQRSFWEERAVMRFSDEGSVAIKMQRGRMTLQAAARLPELLSAGTAER